MKSDREVLGEYCFPEEPVHEEKITFRDLSEYENVDFQGFRGDIYVKEAIIPEGASVIPKSQFLNAEVLKRCICRRAFLLLRTMHLLTVMC